MAKNSSTKTNKKSSKQDIFVSVIVVTRDFDDFPDYCRRLSQRLMGNYTNYEIIIVDNDLSQNSVTAVSGLLDELPCMRLIRLSRQYTYDIAIIAGLEGAIGDYAVVTNPAIDGIEDVMNIVEANKKHDIVQGVADITTKHLLSKSGIGRRLFYWYNRKYINIDIPLQATYLISLNRRAIRAITLSTRHDSHIRHMIRTIGYSYTEYTYSPLVDPVKKHGFGRGTLEALDIITSHSTHPLRFMSWVGFFASVVNMMYALYVVVIALTKKNVAEGWVSTSLELSGMFFILFLFMVILSEYIGKILVESRRDARYYVLDELSSTTSLANAERKNITS